MTTRTITLSDRPPVRIDEDNWPMLAEASDSDHDNQYEFQANRKVSAWLKVRQHEDGRTIVYGGYSYSTRFQSERNVSVRHGSLLSAEEATTEGICAAIREVAGRMEGSVGEPWGDISSWPRLADECMADMPAEQL